MKKLDVILLIIAVLLVSFTVSMLILYWTTGGIPDTLCTCVFSALGGECGACAWIKTTKERREDRRWTRQDKREELKYGKYHDE